IKNTPDLLVLHWKQEGTVPPIPAVPRHPAARARRLGVARAHFQRAFREAVGMTPAHYARHARIGRAKALLREGVALKDVAAECGFADQAHFSRWFRRCFGVAPGRYRVAA
ncbi:helix-turn-helix transcriptional regulator, partial [Variovorax sp. CT11-76]